MQPVCLRGRNTRRLGHRHAQPGLSSGTGSDDGAQALGLLDSFLACDRLDPEDLMARLLRNRVLT
jgi:ADP-ribosylglycohydrolase